MYTQDWSLLQWCFFIVITLYGRQGLPWWYRDSKLSHDKGLVFQKHNLFPWLTIYDNIARCGTYTRAVLKASAWVEEHSEETAAIQINVEYVSGDVETNATILTSYQYIPSVQGGYDALVNVCSDMKEIGLLKDGKDVEAMIQHSYRFFDDVPESYQIQRENFIPVNKE